MYKALFTIMLLISFPQLSSAACEGASSQAEMSRCYGDLRNETESLLHNAIQQYQLKLNPAQNTAFMESQLAWQEYRKKSCAFSSSAALGGSIYDVVLSLCLQSKADERIREIEALQQCQEGDLSCPAW